MSIELCKTLAVTLPDDELARCWRLLYEEHQNREAASAIVNKASLKSGDRVEWISRNNVVTGTVDRVKRKKVLVWADTNGKPSATNRWDIPLGMLTKIS